MTKRCLALILAGFLFPAYLGAQSGSGSSQAGTAQTKPPQQKAPPKVIVHANAVVVPVTVKDPSGNLVANLEQDDFRIFQDGVQQIISGFSDEAVPVSAVVLLDDDLQTKASQQVQQSLDSIAAGFGPSDEVALVRFDEFPKTVLDFTASNDALFAKLKAIRTSEKDGLDSRNATSPSMAMITPPRINGQPIGPGANIPVLASSSGVTKHIDDAVYYAAEMLRTRGRDRRRIIFIISDGVNARYNKWSLNNTLQLLLSSNISVYAIAVGGVLDRPEGVGRLGTYSRSTGGDVFHALKQGDLERMYAALTEEARNQYTLVFDPTNTPGRGNYHSIEVRVERPNLSVTARQGYFAEFPR
ncbi:MAG: VWA domain-containing protein [Candidatus Acidiferrales bacterium]